MESQKIIELFSEKIFTIFNFITEYGINKYPIDFENIESINEHDKINFKAAVHKGFRFGQGEILKEMIVCSNAVKILKEQLKQNRRERNKKEENKTKYTIETIEYMISVYRHFADFIVWQIVKGKHSHIRAMYSGVKTRPSLLNSNIESVVTLVNYHHGKDPNCFALISDLTSFLDIGDVLLINGDSISIIEVKHGKTQERVFNFIDFMSEKNNNIEDYDYSGINEKFFKQVERTMRQFGKGIDFKKFISNNITPNSYTENTKELPYFDNSNRYYEQLSELIRISMIEGFDITVIEDIIYIGAFTREKRNYGYEMMSDIAANYLKISTPIYKFEDIFKSQVVEPLFFKPFGKEVVFQIILQHVKILFLIDFEKLIEAFNKNGVQASWSTTKESHKQSEKESKINKIFRLDNKSIKVKQKDECIYLTEFSIQRLIFDNVLPSSFIN